MMPTIRILPSSERFLNQRQVLRPVFVLDVLVHQGGVRGTSGRNDLSAAQVFVQLSLSPYLHDLRPQPPEPVWWVHLEDHEIRNWLLGGKRNPSQPGGHHGHPRCRRIRVEDVRIDTIQVFLHAYPDHLHLDDPGDPHKLWVWFNRHGCEPVHPESGQKPTGELQPRPRCVLLFVVLEIDPVPLKQNTATQQSTGRDTGDAFQQRGVLVHGSSRPELDR